MRVLFVITAMVACLGSVALAQDPAVTSEQIEKLPFEKACDRLHNHYRNLESRAVKKVMPSYPAEPGFRAKGIVTVKIRLNARGNVISAQPICGHPILRASAVAAAKQWQFVRRKANGRPVKHVGVITFLFPPES
jgi:TonB family protein